jgi:DNA-binding response OmpR family regulator
MKRKPEMMVSQIAMPDIMMPEIIMPDIIMIVEDDMLIAMDAAEGVCLTGAQVLTVRSVRDAMHLLDTAHISAAILDFDVIDGQTTPVAERLERGKIPYRVVSGTSARIMTQAGIDASLIVAKPANYHHIALSLTA